MPVHVSIHDVSPAWSDEVDDALRLCHEYGIRPALLAVPNFHGRAPLLERPDYCARLRALQAEGHEIFLHGFYHRSADRYDAATRSGRIAWTFAQRVASSGEAEMMDISADAGQARIDEGERVLREAGLTIDGFVAPAWSMPPWLLPCLGDRGYRFTEDHLRIYDPRARRSRPSLVLNWATRSPGRLLSTVAFCRAARPARALFPTRIAIHPGDMRFRLVRYEVASALRWARDDIVERASELLRG
jgi:predicted deacetylase